MKGSLSPSVAEGGASKKRHSDTNKPETAGRLSVNATTSHQSNKNAKYRLESEVGECDNPFSSATDEFTPTFSSAIKVPASFDLQPGKEPQGEAEDDFFEKRTGKKRSLTDDG